MPYSPSTPAPTACRLRSAVRWKVPTGSGRSRRRRRAVVAHADSDHPGPDGAGRAAIGRPRRDRVRPRPGRLHRPAHRLCGGPGTGIRCPGRAVARRCRCCRSIRCWCWPSRRACSMRPRPRAGRCWPCSMRAWTRSMPAVIGGMRGAGRPWRDRRWRAAGPAGRGREAMAGNVFEQLRRAAARCRPLARPCVARRAARCCAWRRAAGRRPRGRSGAGLAALHPR